MHNSLQKNAEHQQTSCETNLRYLLGEDQNDPEIIRQIEFMKKEISRLKLVLRESRR